MMRQRKPTAPANRGLRSEGDFAAMWREMAQTEPRVWAIASEPLPGLFAIWEPRLELSEDEEGYVLHAELPGIQRDDIVVEYRDGRLSVRGEQRLEAAVNGAVSRIKHGSRAFRGHFVLNEPVDVDALQMTYTRAGFEAYLPKAVVVGQDMPALAAS